MHVDSFNKYNILCNEYSNVHVLIKLMSLKTCKFSTEIFFKKKDAIGRILIFYSNVLEIQEKKNYKCHQ